MVGGSKGIGRVLVQSLVAAGDEVTVLARSAPAGLGGVRHMSVDLEDAHALETAVDELDTQLPPFRSLVFLQRLRGSESENAWQSEMAVSVEATKTIIEGLTTRRSPDIPGSVVIVSSLAAGLVVSNQPVEYHAAKAALNAIVRFFAVSLAAGGIRVNGVSPGLVLKSENEAHFRDDPAAYEKRVRHIPLRRMAKAQEIVDVIAYLCGDKASFVTGQVIVADGGLSLQFQGTLA